MRKAFVASVVALAFSISSYAQQAKPAIEDLLPSETMLLVTADAKRLRAEYPGSPMEKILNEQEMKVFQDKGLAGLWKLLAQEEKKLGFRVNSLKDLVTGRMAFAFFLKPDPKGELRDAQPGVCFVAELYGQEVAAAQRYTAILEYLKKTGTHVERSANAGPDVIQLGDKEKFFLKLTNGLFVMTNEHGVSVLGAAAQGKAGKPLSELPAFKEFRDRLQGGVNAIFLAEPIQAMVREQAKAKPEDNDSVERSRALDACGWSTLRAAVYTCSRKPGTALFESRFALAATDTKSGFWQLGGTKPFDRKTLELVPVSATSFAVSSSALGDWHKFARSVAEATGKESLAEFDKAIAEAGRKTGIQLATDIQAALGDQVALYSEAAAGAMPFVPQMALIVEAKDPQKAEAIVAALCRYASESMPKGQGSPTIQEAQAGGVTMRYLQVPMPLPIPLSPTVCVVGKYVVVTLNLMQAQRLVNHIQGTTKYETLASKPAVTDALKEVPPEAVSFTWTDTQTNTTQSVAATSILAGMILPAVSRSREEARKLNCKSNLRQIGISCVTYVDNFGKGRDYPEKMKELLDDKLLTDLRGFVCPSDKSPIAWFVDEAEGRKVDVKRSYHFYPEYMEGRVSDAMKSDMAIAWDKAGNHEGGRNVLFLDGHVEFLTEAAFRTMLEQLIKDHPLKKGVVPPWQKELEAPTAPGVETERGEPPVEPEIALKDVQPADLVNFAFWPTQPGLIARHVQPTYSYAIMGGTGMEVVTRGNYQITLDPQTAGVGIVSTMAGLLLPAISRGRDEARMLNCKSNLRQISIAQVTWVDNFGQGRYYASTMKSLYDGKLLTDLRVFECPSDKSPVAWFGDKKRSYEYFPEMIEEKIIGDPPSDLMMAWDKKGNHVRGRNVLFLKNGHVELMPEQAFQDRLAKQMKSFTPKKAQGKAVEERK